jgi:hypothetical protein
VFVAVAEPARVVGLGGPMSAAILAMGQRERQLARKLERATPDQRFREAVGAVACHLRRMRGEDPDTEAAIDACMVGAWA